MLAVFVLCVFCMFWVDYVGKVDRLSIKVPWTKLGSQPIEITFEGVRICVSPRDDQEVSFENPLIEF